MIFGKGWGCGKESEKEPYGIQVHKEPELVWEARGDVEITVLFVRCTIFLATYLGLADQFSKSLNAC